MNFVWYVALGGHTPTIHAHHPSRVKAWEPVPSFAAFTQYGLLLNNLTHLVEVGLVVGACGVECPTSLCLVLIGCGANVRRPT